MGWWTTDRQAYAVNYLISAGLSVYGAAGLVSRWANVESTGAGPTSVNPLSGAFGIAQWLGARKAGIYPNTNFDAQLAYVVSELDGSESRAGNQLRAAGDPQSGAIGASMYERAEGYNAGSGRDNYTGRTAAGVSAVLQAANQAPAASSVAADQTDQSGVVAAGLTTTTALFLVGGLAVVWWLLSD